MTQAPKKLRLPIDGILLLDKSAGISSNDALVQAKRLLNAKKAGHTGTLDPFATGLLPLCFGEATKFSQDLLEADKTYETVIHLGISTATGDTEGEIVSRCEVAVTRSQVEEKLTKFRGEIEQVPPMHSALKRDGKPLYEYARAGITLERQARRVRIHELDLLAFEPPYIKLRVKCSKGTYIRVLGADIGAALGCGAHLQALRRTGVGNLELNKAITLEQLAAFPEQARLEALAPVDALLSSFPKIVLSEELAKRFLHGQRIALTKEGINIPFPSGRVRVYQVDNDCLLGTAQLQEFGLLSPERLIAPKTHPTP
ncbi:MAG: tRNA pseudouridine(55) synthase TruB [Burkholderiales bacterium]|nr:tRNA pseudouridine(55) synthase TruB [Burkholderiales bacterium]